MRVALRLMKHRKKAQAKGKFDAAKARPWDGSSKDQKRGSKLWRKARGAVKAGLIVRQRNASYWRRLGEAKHDHTVGKHLWAHARFKVSLQVSLCTRIKAPHARPTRRGRCTLQSIAQPPLMSPAKPVMSCVSR